ncbi:MAG: roadblock/LC7 domain-containing protein [Candidatus Micrarchaeia archaeon]
MTMIERMHDYIKKNRDARVDGYVVARRDGIKLVSTIEESPHISAITAAIIGSAESFIQSMGAEVKSVSVIIESDKLNAVMMGAGTPILVAAIAKPGVELHGLVPHVKKLVEELSKMVEKDGRKE